MFSLYSNGRGESKRYMNKNSRNISTWIIEDGYWICGSNNREGYCSRCDDDSKQYNYIGCNIGKCFDGATVNTFTNGQANEQWYSYMIFG